MSDWLAVLVTHTGTGCFNLEVRADDERAAKDAVWEWLTQHLYLQKPREVFRLVSIGRIP